MKASKNFRRLDGVGFADLGEAHSVHGRVSAKEPRRARGHQRSLPSWERPLSSLGDALREAGVTK